MMDKETSKRFSNFARAGVCSIIWFLNSCSTANSSHINPTQDILSDIKPPGIDIRAELSSTQVVAGTIVLVSINVPPLYRNTPIVGKFEGLEFPFFSAEQEISGESKTGLYEAVLGIPYERKPGPGKVSIHMGDGKESSHLEISLDVVKGDYLSETLNVNARRVNPGKKDMRRIKREQAEIAKIYEQETLRKYWQGPFAFPIHSPVTSPFGTKRTYNGELKSFHTGLDLKAPVGTPIYSAAPGAVVMAKNLFYTGNTVIIDHGYGIITLYAHMSKLKVKLGDVVPMRGLLGWSGKTGRVNGPHLHWQAIVHRTKINPIGLTQVITR